MTHLVPSIQICMYKRGGGFKIDDELSTSGGCGRGGGGGCVSIVCIVHM